MRDAEIAIGLLDQPHDSGKFFLDLFRSAKNMRVVERHAADATETAEDARTLVAVHRAEFGDSHGQVAVTVFFGFVNENVMRAIHRPQHQLLGFQVHRGKHVFVVVRPVSGTDVEVNLREVRSVNMLVAGAAFLFQDVFLEKPANRGAFRQPERQTGIRPDRSR